MDISISPVPSSSSSLGVRDSPSPATPPELQDFIFLVSSIRASFAVPSIDNLAKINLIASFVRKFYLFQGSQTESSDAINQTISILRREISTFIKEYQCSLPSPISAFDQTILLMMEGIKINPFIEEKSPTDLIQHGKSLLDIYPDAHPAAVAYLLTHLSLRENPAASGYFTFDCQFAILFLTTELHQLNVQFFSLEEHSCLVEALFPLRLNTYVKHSQISASSDAHYTDTRCSRPIEPFLLRHPLFPSDSTALFEARKKIALITKSREIDPIYWGTHLLQAKWFFLTEQKEAFTKEIKNYLEEYFSTRTQNFSIALFIENLSLHFQEYFPMNTRSWEGFPDTKELLTAILSLPLPIDRFLLQVPVLLEITDPESKNILFDHLTELYISFQGVNFIQNKSSLWRYLIECAALKPPSDLTKILVQSLHLITNHPQMQPIHPPIDQLCNALLISQSRLKKISLSTLLFKASSNPSKKAHELTPASIVPSYQNIMAALTTLSQTLLSPNKATNHLQQTASFIQLFYAFQESLRNKLPLPSILQLQIHDIAFEITTLIKQIDVKKTSLSPKEESVLLLLHATLLSPYFGKISTNLTLIQNEGKTFLEMFKKAHPVAIAYLFNQLSLNSDSSKNYFPLNCYTAILMLSQNLYDFPEFTLQDHTCMMNLFSPIHHTALTECLILINKFTPTIYLHSKFQACILPLLQESSLFHHDEAALLEVRKRIAFAIIPLSRSHTLSNEELMKGIHFFIHFNEDDLLKPLPLPILINSKFRLLYIKFYQPFFQFLTNCIKNLPSPPPLFCLPEMNRRWTALSLSENQQFDLLSHKKYLQELILSQDPKELIQIIKTQLSTNFLKEINRLFNIMKHKLNGEFQEIFRHFIFLSILEIINDDALKTQLEEILKSFLQKKLLNYFSLEDQNLLFQHISDLYCTPPQKRENSDILETLLWDFLIEMNTSLPANKFRPILIRGLDRLANYPHLFSFEPLLENFYIFSATIHLTLSNTTTTLKSLLVKGSIIATEIFEIKELFQSRIEEQALKIKTLESSLEPRKQEIRGLNKALEKERKRTADLALKEKTLQEEIIKVRTEVAFLEKALSNSQTQLQLNLKEEIESLIKSVKIECPISFETIRTPCLLTPAGLEKFQGISPNTFCDLEGLKATLKTDDISLFITTDLSLMRLALHEHAGSLDDQIQAATTTGKAAVLYKMDTTETIDSQFKRIQNAAEKLAKISSTNDSQLKSTRREALEILQSVDNFRSLSKILLAPFVPDTAGIIIEGLMTRILTLVEMSSKLLLTYQKDKSAILLTIQPNGQMGINSHRVVDLLREVCAGLNVTDLYSSFLQDLSEINLNSVRSEYLPSVTKSSTSASKMKKKSMAEILSGLRLSLSHKTDKESVAIQIQDFILCIEEILSVTADLMEKQIQIATTPAPASKKKK